MVNVHKISRKVKMPPLIQKERFKSVTAAASVRETRPPETISNNRLVSNDRHGLSVFDEVVSEDNDVARVVSVKRV